MKKDKKVMKYQAGDMVEAPQESMGAMMGALGAGAGAGATEAGIEGALADVKVEKIKSKNKKGKKKKKKKMMGGGMLKYGHGGGVKGGKPRGCGMARQGVRNAKMVVMKGS